MERYRAAESYTAPTVIRSAAGEGREHVERRGISSLKLRGHMLTPLPGGAPIRSWNSSSESPGRPEPRSSSALGRPA